MNDILLGSDNDLLIESGDLVIGTSDEQHQLHLLQSSKGEYKRNPEIGANILDMISDDSPKQTLKEIKRQLEYDGAEVESVSYKDGQLNIKAKY